MVLFNKSKCRLPPPPFPTLSTNCLLYLLQRQRSRNKPDRHCTYKSNIKGHSSNQSCHGKAISITYSGCATVALASILHFPHYLINGTIFSNKLLNIKRVFLFVYNCCLNISDSKKNSEKLYEKCTQVFKSRIYSLLSQKKWSHIIPVLEKL